MDFSKEKGFDDVAKEAMEYLLEQFWVLRKDQPEIHYMIRSREYPLRNYFFDKMGYHLIVHRHFAKLEKIPAEPEPWMGISSFKKVLDYTLFCCLMAFLESKNVDEQFLLSELCEELESTTPTEEELDWTIFDHRKSLVRVLQKAAELGVIKVVDGDIAGFSQREDYEVLYEVPLASRYFMRSYPKDLFKFSSKEEILDSEWQGMEEDRGDKRRYRVYRKLFLSPGMYSKGKDDPDFLYLRNFRNRIRDDIEKHTDFQFELFRNTALLTLQERKARYNLFPDNRAIADITLQFASLVRNKQVEEDIPTQFDGSLMLFPVDFTKWVEELKESYGSGWSKQYREAPISEIVKDILSNMKEWKMAEEDQESKGIYLKPLLVRVIGKYPKDFTGENSANRTGGK